ncbi:MAG TPA: hypothetical protein P5229_04570, partial [Candidatus Gracilibacteria bacterium]|nr:hypothetical protein [Candidatus Gracilibacteria bacterium]
LSGIMDALALSMSMNLQYGVPLEVIVSKFTHARFEPAGMTINRDIPMVKSIIDYFGRWMALKFLPRDVAKKYHNSDLVDRAYSEGNAAFLPQLPEEPVSVKEEVAATIVEADAAGRIHRSPKVMEVKQVEVAEIVQTAVKISGSSREMSLDEFGKMQKDKALRLNSEDAPTCSTCGSVTVRNGSCYKCLDCGETTGCS